MFSHKKKSHKSISVSLLLCKLEKVSITDHAQTMDNRCEQFYDEAYPFRPSGVAEKGRGGDKGDSSFCEINMGGLSPL